jgi:hypothetical protein
MKQIVKFSKDFLLVFPLTYLLRPFSRFFIFLVYFNRLIAWIWTNKHQFAFNDFYKPFRDYSKRFDLYGYIANSVSSSSEPIIYLEFGVAEGASFHWWQKANPHKDSLFFGFDTFEGLPEKWGAFYKKGDMKFSMPELTDKRGSFVKGIFQDTVTPFIAANRAALTSDKRKIILLDADLYSATIFTLSQLYPTLKKGDIILFDEFTVALHEFKAYTEFIENFYITLKPLAAVNNFYQLAFEVA